MLLFGDSQIFSCRITPGWLNRSSIMICVKPCSSASQCDMVLTRCSIYTLCVDPCRLHLDPWCLCVDPRWLHVDPCWFHVDLCWCRVSKCWLRVGSVLVPCMFNVIPCEFHVNLCYTCVNSSCSVGSMAQQSMP